MKNSYEAGEIEEIHHNEDDVDSIESAGEVQQREEQHELKPVDFEDSPHGGRKSLPELVDDNDEGK